MRPRTPRGFLRSDNRRRRRPATRDQDRDDRDDGLLDRWVSLRSWTTRCARSCASSSPSPAFDLMRSMIPSPSRRAASSTSESRRPVRAARTRTWRIRPSSIESVVFTFPIFPYCHKSHLAARNDQRAQRRRSGRGRPVTVSNTEIEGGARSEAGRSGGAEDGVCRPEYQSSGRVHLSTRLNLPSCSTGGAARVTEPN